jgi:hypothetical protein
MEKQGMIYHAPTAALFVGASYMMPSSLPTKYAFFHNCPSSVTPLQFREGPGVRFVRASERAGGFEEGDFGIGEAEDLCEDV